MSKEKLKLKYKYIHFQRDKQRQGEWVFRNNEELLGFVSYYKQWNQYVAEFLEDRVFNNQCLKDIADFLEQLNRRTP